MILALTSISGMWHTQFAGSILIGPGILKCFVISLADDTATTSNVIIVIFEWADTAVLDTFVLTETFTSTRSELASGLGSGIIETLISSR